MNFALCVLFRYISKYMYTPPTPFHRTHLTWVFQDYMLPGNMCFVQGPVSWKRLKRLNVPDFSADTGPCAHSCQKFPYLIHTITQYKLHVTHAYIDQLASFAQKTYIPSVVYECLCFHSDREPKKNPASTKLWSSAVLQEEWGVGFDGLHLTWYVHCPVQILAHVYHTTRFPCTTQASCSSQRTENNLYLLDMLQCNFHLSLSYYLQLEYIIERISCSCSKL